MSVANSGERALASFLGFALHYARSASGEHGRKIRAQPRGRCSRCALAAASLRAHRFGDGRSIKRRPERRACRLVELAVRTGTGGKFFLWFFLYGSWRIAFASGETELIDCLKPS